MTTLDIELPAEFRSGNSVPVTVATIKRERMEEIIRAAIEADRKRRGEPTAAEISDVIREITGCPDIKNGEDSLVVALGILFHRCATTQSSEPDYKQLFEQMCERCDALDAKLAEYSEREPVGYIMPTALKQLKAGGNAIVGGVSQGFDVPLYADPQQVVPLTHEKIRIIWKETRARMSAGGDPVLWFARAIERAHGISTPQPAEPCASSVSDKTACGSENGDCDSQPAEPIKDENDDRLLHPDVAFARFAAKKYGSPQPAEPVKVPSDSDIMVEWASTPNTGDMRVDLVVFARALLARYGNTQQEQP